MRVHIGSGERALCGWDEIPYAIEAKRVSVIDSEPAIRRRAGLDDGRTCQPCARRWYDEAMRAREEHLAATRMV